jgi:hypothetical protein
VKREAEAARGAGGGGGVRAVGGVSWGARAACGATLGSEVPAVEEG